MPITDFLRSFVEALSYAGMSPQQQHEALLRKQQLQMEQQAGQADAEQKERMFQAQYGPQGRYAQELDLRRQQQMIDLIRGGAYPQGAMPAGNAANLQGGPGLSATGPTTAEAPTPTTIPPPVPNATSRGGDSTAVSLMPFLNMMGLQQSGGQNVNAATQQGGPTTPASRVAPTGATSGGGGVISPAAAPMPSASPAAPNVFNFTGPGNKSIPFVLPNQTTDDPMIPVLPEVAAKLGYGNVSQIPKSQYAPNEALFREATMQSILPKPAREPDMKAQAMLTAVQEVNPKGQTIEDVPAEQRGKVFDRAIDLQAGELGRQQKEANLAAAKDREQKVQDARASDDAMYAILHNDGQALFDIKDNAQKDRMLVRAKAEGFQLPTRQIPKQGQMADGLLAANVVQRAASRMEAIARALGPEDFGAVIGRLNNAEGKWGATFFKKDDARAELEQDFRLQSAAIAAQETKLLGGGRASVMLFNIIRDVSARPALAPALLKGALRGTEARAQMTKDSVNDWAYGRSEKPFVPNTSTYKKGDVVTLKSGARVRLLADPDKDGNAPHEPVQ